jgi:uncharacterized membrane protein YccC
MNINSVTRFKSHAGLLLEEWLGDWLHKDVLVMAYIIKVLLACLLALWLSLRFELEQPKIAMLTVVIVMQNRFGMVFTKSLYRLLGTLVGIACSFVLVAMFAQERVLFLACMALWIGFCTAGSMVFRHHQSYGFVLAGYTICIVGLPSTIDPTLTFDIGVTRISEIMMGLLSATIVSDLIFPQRMGEALEATLKRRFYDFSQLLQGALSERETQHQALLKFVADVFEVETYRASSGFENDNSRHYRMRLAGVNAAFMHVSTSFHSLEQLIRRQRKTGHPRVVMALLALYEPLAATMHFAHEGPVNALVLQGLIKRLQQLHNVFANKVHMAKAVLSRASAKEHLDFETGAEYIQRFAFELEQYLQAYAYLLSEQPATAPVTQWPALTLHVDPIAAGLAGARGALALLLMTSLWILLDWRSGIEAITIGVITSTLFATSPQPTKTIKQFVIGAALGTVLVYICNFYLLPDAQGMPMLALALMPCIVIAAWFTTQPNMAIIGAGAFIVFFLHVGFNASYSANPVAFLNDAIADAVAITMSGVMYSLIDLSTSDWARKRVANALRAMVVESAASIQDRTLVETQARDLVQRLGSTKRVADKQDKEVVDWLFSTLEICYAIQQLRAQLLGMPDAHFRQVLYNSLREVAALYDAPSTAQRLVAMASMDNAIDVSMRHVQALAHSRLQADALQLLTALHSMRCVLLDHESVLAKLAPIAISEPVYAA